MPSPSSHITRRVDPARAVALESVILAHGLPRPRNLEVGRRCEALVREGGGDPATIGIVPGQGVVVGMNDDEVREIAARDGVVKTNLSNLAAVLASGHWGATSVSTCLWACEQAGVRVFVTGGIGGVHRGFGTTLDISADLTALGRMPVAVVCAGVKSLLDVAATREHLETLGVPVVGWGCDHMPMFYVRQSAERVDARFDDIDALARFLRLHFEVSGTAVLVGNPIPGHAAFTSSEMDHALAAAEARVAAQGGARGRDSTPALLAALREVTNGRTLEANVALIESNAALGGRLAAAMARL